MPEAYGPFASEAAIGQWVAQMDAAGVDMVGSTLAVISPKQALKQAGQTEAPVTRQATVCLICEGVGKCKGFDTHYRVWKKDGKEFLSKTLYVPGDRQKKKLTKAVADGRIG